MIQVFCSCSIGCCWYCANIKRDANQTYEYDVLCIYLHIRLVLFSSFFKNKLFFFTETEDVVPTIIDEPEDKTSKKKKINVRKFQINACKQS